MVSFDSSLFTCGEFAYMCEYLCSTFPVLSDSSLFTCGEFAYMCEYLCSTFPVLSDSSLFTCGEFAYMCEYLCSTFPVLSDSSLFTCGEFASCVNTYAVLSLYFQIPACFCGVFAYPASQPTDCPQSPVISNKSELFSPPSAPFQRSSTALSTMPWKPYSRPVQNSELLHSDLMSRLATSLPFRPTDVTLQDIYSQRLRQLAGQPNASTSPPSVNSPVTKKPPSLGNSEAPSAFSAPSVKGAKNSAAANEGDKGYTCPICNKQFRFKVTLMAHQRNHTGRPQF